jgi:cysteine desulfuration protein SufE
MVFKESLEDVREAFALFSDWEERYAYIIDLGKKIPPFPDHEKTEENIVKGCVSRVWMISDTKDGLLQFKADSDAHIVRGLIGLLMIIYENKPLEFVQRTDIQKIFSDLGLEQNLSPNRRNGFYAMVERLKKSSF